MLEGIQLHLLEEEYYMTKPSIQKIHEFKIRLIFWIGNSSDLKRLGVGKRDHVAEDFLVSLRRPPNARAEPSG